MYGKLASDTMSGEQPGRPTLSLSEYPDPACSFTTVDGTPVVETTNAAFETQFGAGAEGMPVADALERPGLELSHGSGHVPRRLAQEESFRVRTSVNGESPGQEGSGETGHGEHPDKEYLVRTVTTGDGGG
jgi:hypothetical protein